MAELTGAWPVAAPADHAERRTLTVPEATRVLGISRNTAYRAAKRGDLPTLRLGRRLVVPRDWLEAALAGAPLSAALRGQLSFEPLPAGGVHERATSPAPRGLLAFPSDGAPPAEPEEQAG